MTEKTGKPWLDEKIMRNLYSMDAVTCDEDVTQMFRNQGHEVSRRTVTDARNALGIPAKSKGQFFNVSPDEYDDAKADKDEIWNLIIKLQTELRKENHAKRDVRINVQNDEPIGIFFAGDLHIGDVGTDHQALIRDVKKIQATEGLYGTLGGDYINNFIKQGLAGKKIKNHEAVPVEFAWKLTLDVFDRLKDSLLAILLGNHDEWTDQMAEFDKVAELVEQVGVPYGKHGANVHITFPTGQHYKIRLRHKFRFESSLNLLNAVKQMYRFDEPFDIGVLHHLHTPEHQMWMQHGIPTYAIRPGSYKVEDDFAYALGYTTTGFGMSRKFGTDASCKYSIPVAVLWPNERRIHISSTIDEGIDYLAYARDAYSRGKIVEG